MARTTHNVWPYPTSGDKFEIVFVDAAFAGQVGDTETPDTTDRQNAARRVVLNITEEWIPEGTLIQVFLVNGYWYTSWGELPFEYCCERVICDVRLRPDSTVFELCYMDLCYLVPRNMEFEAANIFPADDCPSCECGCCTGTVPDTLYATFNGISELFDSCDRCTALNGVKVALTRASACSWIYNQECAPDLGIFFGYFVEVEIGTGGGLIHGDPYSCECDTYYIHVTLRFYNAPNQPECGCVGIPIGVGQWGVPEIHWQTCYTSRVNCSNLNEALDYTGDNGDHDPGGGGCTGGTVTVSSV
jgi:hypothetical protein